MPISKYNSLFKSRAGLTLIELLVSLTVAGMVILAISSLFVILFTSNVRNKQLEEIAQAEYDISTDLTNSVRWSLTDPKGDPSTGTPPSSQIGYVNLDPGVTSCSDGCYCKLELRVECGVDPSGCLRIYQLNPGTDQLTRYDWQYAHDTSINSKEVAVTCLKVIKLSDQPAQDSVKIQIDLQHKQFTSIQDTINIVVSQRKTEL